LRLRNTRPDDDRGELDTQTVVRSNADLDRSRYSYVYDPNLLLSVLSYLDRFVSHLELNCADS